MTQQTRVWICTKCNRPFRNKNQEHSCVRVSVEKHFENKNHEVKVTYERLMSRARKFGSLYVSAAEQAILIKSRSTFLAVKPKKQCLDIEFILERAVTEFPVHKTVAYTRKKFAHFVRLDDPRQADGQLLAWLKESYELASR